MSGGDAGPMVVARRLEDGAVLDLCLNRPKANVLSTAMMSALIDEISSQKDDPHLKLVILRGAGGHFSFGASVEEHRKAEAPRMLASFRLFCRQLVACPVPVAALVEGRCLGGAFEAVMCCNFVFAAPGAKLGCPEVRLGVFPPVLAALGPLRLGGTLTDHLTISGGILDLDVAKSVGFLTGILDGEGDPLDQLLAWYGDNMASSSAFALRQATAAARRGSGLIKALGAPLVRLERQYVEEVLESHDGNEGIEAFLERRPAKWKDN